MVDESFSGNATGCDYVTGSRAGFISLGTIISAVGCVCNAMLLYVFLTRTRRQYPFQTLLAFLDFMMCGLYIFCFAFHLIAVEMRITWMYNWVMDTNVTSFVMSRIVQLAIPYTLIANTADKLTMIMNLKTMKYGFHCRIAAMFAMMAVATFLRINLFVTLEVTSLPSCDFFHSKWLSQVNLPPNEAEMWGTFENVLTFFHTFVSFVILALLNVVVVMKLRIEHRTARRQSTSPAQLFSLQTLTTRMATAEELRQHQNRLRCAVRTTVVIISAYLACNSLNFILYMIEKFNSAIIVDEDGSFTPMYVIASDIASNLFVLSSAMRLFIFYKYNPELRQQIQSVGIVQHFLMKQGKKADILLTTVDV